MEGGSGEAVPARRADADAPQRRSHALSPSHLRSVAVVEKAKAREGLRVRERSALAIQHVREEQREAESEGEDDGARRNLRRHVRRRVARDGQVGHEVANPGDWLGRAGEDREG